MTEVVDKRRFTRQEYAALYRLRSHNADFQVVVAALERRLQEHQVRLVGANPDTPGKIGQLQGQCRELADILESIHGAATVLQTQR